MKTKYHFKGIPMDENKIKDVQHFIASNIFALALMSKENLSCADDVHSYEKIHKDVKHIAKVLQSLIKQSEDNHSRFVAKDFETLETKSLAILNATTVRDFESIEKFMKGWISAKHGYAETAFIEMDELDKTIEFPSK